jgi:hypothetical protein
MPFATITPEWQSLSPLLDEALELPADLRPAWLAGLGARISASQREALGELIALQSSVESDGFLERLPSIAPGASHVDAGAAPGLIVGPYRLIEELDTPLQPTDEHIHRIGEALAAIAEIRIAIGQLRPDLVPPYEPPSEEVSAANRRLGPVLLRAYDRAERSQLAEAVSLLEKYVKNETSEYHRDIATGEIDRLTYDHAT